MMLGNDEVNQVKKIIKNAGLKVMAIYNTDYSYEDKGNGQGPVTQADLESNEYLCQELFKQFPSDVICSEENKDVSERMLSNRVWCIDPLDGTKDFMKKNGEFAIHVGFICDHQPVFGFVYLPFYQELFYGGHNYGAFLEKNDDICALKVSQRKSLNEMIMVGSRSHRTDDYQMYIDRVSPLKEIQKGSLGLKACLIAKGEVDFFFYPTPHTKEWDSCAPQAILEGAGGCVSDMKGDSVKYNKESLNNPFGVVFSNGKNHLNLVNCLNGVS